MRRAVHVNVSLILIGYHVGRSRSVFWRRRRCNEDILFIWRRFTQMKLMRSRAVRINTADVASLVSEIVGMRFDV
jgi:hypothetical protein